MTKNIDNPFLNTLLSKEIIKKSINNLLNPIISPPTEINGMVKIWKNEKGEWHRTGGPAVVGLNGYKAWYQKDKLHRLNAPAITYSDGTQYWYHRGQRHNENGPAVVCPDGAVEYWLNDKKYSKHDWEKKVLEIKEKKNDHRRKSL